MKENFSLFSENGFRQDECTVSKKFLWKIIRIMILLKTRERQLGKDVFYYL